MDTAGAAVDLSFQIVFGIIGMTLLTVFIIIFFVVYQRRLLQQQLTTQKMEAAYQKKLLNSGILTQEEERSRMAVDHDSIGGLLSATKIYVSNVTQELPGVQFQLFKSKALETLNENISEIRTITNDLLPQSLKRLGVVTATRNLTPKLSELKQILVEFSANMEERFDPDKEKALFRIMQELINNTLKHSTASQVTIDFNFTAEALSVIYQENGQGFDLPTQEKQNDHKSLGLSSIESRIAFLNGQYDYKTAPGQGVEVNLSFTL